MVNISKCFEATHNVYVSIGLCRILIKNTTINLRTREGVIRPKGLAHCYDIRYVAASPPPSVTNNPKPQNPLNPAS